MTDTELLEVARGDAPADTLLRGGRVVNVFTAEVERVDLALHGGRIAGLGPGYRGREEVELDGAWVLPGFVDAHVHVESSLATPFEFARAVVPRGTTTVVSDPHEIANVHGLEGIRYMLDASEGLPLTVFVMASSCVPATDMSTSGASLDAAALETLLGHPRVLGLAEVMNFPGVIHGDPEVLAKLRAFHGRPVDGHAPGVSGPALNAYVAAGPASDHECTTADEAREKLRRGLHVFFRQATNARNLADLLPALTPENAGRVCLCTDDRQPPDLLDDGGIDHMLRTVIRAGVDPIHAVRLATLNPAGFFGLHDRGAVAPGRRADLLVVDDLPSLAIREVWAGGRPVARDGAAEGWTAPEVEPPEPSMLVALPPEPFHIPAREGRVRVIEAVPGQLVTGADTVEPTVRDGAVVADPERDLVKLAVVERHTGSGRVGTGLLRGMGLRAGALAGTVAHDHHNIITAGVDDASMMTAVRAVAEVRGGLAVARGEEVLARLALPVGGLMSRRPMEEIRALLDEAVAAARGLGSPLHDPFMALSFLGLEVIPALKLTDHGLVDVEAFQPVPLWA
jgi:adenine deaminase